MRKYDKEEIFDCLLIKDHLWKAYEKVKDIKAQAKHMYWYMLSFVIRHDRVFEQYLEILASL